MTGTWPVLTRYDADHLDRIALPLGGIGTGTVSLGGRGDLRDWEIVNRPAKGFTPSDCFFALYARAGDRPPVTRALEGPLPATIYEGATGGTAVNHGLPRFRDATFDAAYPFGRVHLSDPDVPVAVRIEAFNPLVPPDPDRSGLPVAVLRFVLRNPGDAPVAASVCGSLRNFIGDDGVNALARAGRNAFRRGDGVAGLLLASDGVPPEAETWGTMALVALVPDDAAPDAVSHCLARPVRSWGGGLLDFWDDFADDGALEPCAPSPGDDRPVGSLALNVTVPPRGEARATFLIAWHFPNRQSWSPDDGERWLADGACAVGGPTIGNYYTTRFADAWDAAARVAADLPALETETAAFVGAVCDADLPAVVKEAALYNLSTLRTQTVFRTPDGRLFGWEGCHDRHGSCLGSCTHVWNYENTLPFLFGGLSRAMREVEFGWATRPDSGLMAFRVHLPLSRASRNNGLAAADGQMGCLMRLYRDWRLCGDDDWLRSLWPHAKRAMEFCWIPGGWDADRDGLMEGCQHNTMDVEYYGPNPQMGAWYLGALRACEEMARHLGDVPFADECRRLYESGRRRMDAELFNGEYYEHRIEPPADARDAIAPGLRHPNMGARDLSEPELQLGAGCLIDQLVGQYMAHVCDLGHLLRPENVRAALRSVLAYNRRRGFHDHFNPMRSFVLGDESAVLMASYPRGRRPERPFPYYSEVMTGFEHQLAAHLIYEGMAEEGVGVVADIRARYDGRKRSPFDEAECGHHYARAMAAWTHLLALTGFHYDAHRARMTFALSDRPVTWFWSTGAAWGTVRLTPDADEANATLRVKGGAVALRAIAAGGLSGEITGDARRMTVNHEMTLVLRRADAS